jgi:hypothetical protein
MDKNIIPLDSSNGIFKNDKSSAIVDENVVNKEILIAEIENIV